MCPAFSPPAWGTTRSHSSMSRTASPASASIRRNAATRRASSRKCSRAPAPRADWTSRSGFLPRRPGPEAPAGLFTLSSHVYARESGRLRTLSPLDTETIVDSVSTTGRCVVVHEGPRTCGIAAEIIARINEHAFEHLLAPIKRVTGYDIHFPHFQCEEHYLPDAETIIEAVKETLAYE
ncbi:MAG: hypothetical protein IH804_01805 [Planctomycetes bacterium]|nr:hypothetical protein [Planctomycetota bacterium]